MVPTQQWEALKYIYSCYLHSTPTHWLLLDFARYIQPPIHRNNYIHVGRSRTYKNKYNSLHHKLVWLKTASCCSYQSATFLRRNKYKLINSTWYTWELQRWWTAEVTAVRGAPAQKLHLQVFRYISFTRRTGVIIIISGFCVGSCRLN
jgi:hypothetical protein